MTPLLWQQHRASASRAREQICRRSRIVNSSAKTSRTITRRWLPASLLRQRQAEETDDDDEMNLTKNRYTRPSLLHIINNYRVSQTFLERLIVPLLPNNGFRSFRSSCLESHAQRLVTAFFHLRLGDQSLLPKPVRKN
jgi:hypothetical protein